MPVHEAIRSDLRGTPAGDLGASASYAMAVIGHQGGLRPAAAMRRLRSYAAKSAAIAIPAAALLVPVGAYAATTQNAGLVAAHAVAASQIAGQSSAARQLPAATFTWHKLVLINGWTAASSGTGKPAYAISGGVVYLSGSLRQPVAGRQAFAVLPKSARPGHWLYRTVYTNGGTTGTLLITPDGTLQAYSFPVGYAQGYTSLAAVSFPVAGFTWHKLTLRNGWTSGQSFGTGSPRYAVKGGVVYLSGSVKQLSGTSREFAVLPKAARPAHKMYLTVYTFGGTAGSLLIGSTGGLFASSTPQSNAQGFTSLAAISYPVSGTAWHKLTLINGWMSGQDISESGSPAYAIIGGVVYLSGSLQQPTGTGTQFAHLPAAARPAHWLYIAVYTNGGTIGYVGIPPVSAIYANSNPPSNSQSFTSLAAISYPRTS